jgi:hypothetical protein
MPTGVINYWLFVKNAAGGVELWSV